MSGTAARRPRSLAGEQPGFTKRAGLNEDDNACCRAYGGPVGSPEFVACRNDRDTRRSAALARADSRQRDLGEYMMNHPDHP